MAVTIPGSVLSGALRKAGMTQAELARRVHVDKRTVNRWTQDGPSLQGPMARKVEQLLAEVGVELDLAPTCRVFLATPMAALDPGAYGRVRAEAEAVHAALDRAGGPVYWAAGEIDSTDRFEAPDQATGRNWDAIEQCEAFVYFQPYELERATGGLTELGMAIMARKPTTVFAPSEQSLPYMFQRFESAAAQRGVRYRFYPADDALRLLEIHGGELLGLDRLVAA